MICDPKRSIYALIFLTWSFETILQNNKEYLGVNF